MRNGLPVFDKSLKQLLDSVDYAVGNFEGPESESKNISKSGIALSNPPGAISFLNQHNIKVLNLANNHTMDRGVPGLQDTIRKAAESGSLYLGAGEDINRASAPLYLDGSGVRVALISCMQREGMPAAENCAGVFFEEEITLIRNRINEARKQAKYVVLIYHGGAEFIRYPIPVKRKLLKKFLGFGVDIVIAHHPHVMQPVEQVGEKCIFYSLGNFIFDIPVHKNYSHTNSGLLVELQFNSDGYKTFLHEYFSTDGMLNLKKPDENFLYKEFTKIDFQKDADRVWRERKRAIRNEKEKEGDFANEKSTPWKKVGHYFKMLTGKSTFPIIKSMIIYRLKKRVGLIKD